MTEHAFHTGQPQWSLLTLRTLSRLPPLALGEGSSVLFDAYLMEQFNEGGGVSGELQLGGTQEVDKVEKRKRFTLGRTLGGIK